MKGRENETNLLEETRHFLEKNGKTLEDILYATVKPYISICDTEDEAFLIEKDRLTAVLDTNYDADFGDQEINPTLKLVGKDFWIERREYDGN